MYLNNIIPSNGEGVGDERKGKRFNRVCNAIFLTTFSGGQELQSIKGCRRAH